MYKSGLYQIGAGINQLGGSNNYNLLGYPVGFYTNTGLTDMNETVSRPILSVNEYLSGGSPLPMYNIGSGEEPFILDDIQGGKKKRSVNTSESVIKKYERKNLRDKKNAIKYPSLYNKDKIASMTKGTLKGGDKSHLRKMKSLLKDLEKHRDNKDSIEKIIQKHKATLEGAGFKGGNIFDWIADRIPDIASYIPIVGPIMKPILNKTLNALDPYRKVKREYGKED
jgi:hypothetical protein